MSKELDKDAVDFLPDALALRHSRLPWHFKYGILILCSAFLIFITFAFMAKIDVIVSGTGKLVSDHPTVMLKPLERTVIKDIRVTVGEQVKAGQVLATFDPVFSAAEMERLDSEAKILKAQLDRIKLELRGMEYNLPEKPNEEEILQRKIFMDRRDYYNQKDKQFANEISALNKTKTSLQENIALQEGRLAKFRDIEAMLNRAGVSKAVSARDLKDAQINRMQLEADISDKKNSILVTESELNAKENEANAFRSNWNIELSEEYVKTGTSLTSVLKDLDKARQMANYTELLAPEDAVVHEIAPFSRGSAIREAETLFTLVPIGGRLEAEVEIRAEDIGRIKVGDKTRLKISAFPFQKHGTISGDVRVISEDSFLREGPGQSGAYYKARIRFDKDQPLVDKLIPGMEAQGDIKAGKRSVLEYLIHPIIKSLDEAIREP